MPDNVRFALGGIKYIKSKAVMVFNDDVVSIIEQIENGRLARSYKTNAQHVKYVKEIVKDKLDSKVCSKYGS